MPSDYRYDPFNNIAEPVAITGETHIIPSNSPYTIRLAEVPVKESPSTVSLTIGGVAGVEVAANPAAGEFRCDYTTGADEDDNWNTGLIQFNAADAGKTVVAAYNGMGTLASVNADHYPSLWLDRGDGSDGDYTVTNGDTISGLKQYKSLVIPAGVVLNVGYEKIPLIILCQGAVIIDGTIYGKGDNGQAGSTAAQTPVNGRGNGGDGGTVNSAPGKPGSGGGAGGRGTAGGEAVAGGASIYKDVTVAAQNTSPSVAYQNWMARSLSDSRSGGGGGAGTEQSGSGGGAGGGGGGTVLAIAETIINNGSINVAGGATSTKTFDSTYNSSSGGAGGASVTIIAKSIKIGSTGKIDVSGGNAGLCRDNLYSQNGGSGWYKFLSLG